MIASTGYLPLYNLLVNIMLLVQLSYFTVWSVPEAATSVLCTPDNGCDGCPKHVE